MYSYKLLLKWNPNIPIIALKSVKTTWTLQRLGKKTEEREGYPVLNLSWLGTSRVSGSFKITEKRIESVYSEEEVVLTCVWLSGENIGEKFKLSKLDSFKAEEGKYKPDSIYYPPQIVVWLFEIIISLSALITVIELVSEAWKYVKPLITNAEVIKLLIVTWNSICNIWAQMYVTLSSFL